MNLARTGEIGETDRNRKRQLENWQLADERLLKKTVKNGDQNADG
jgi:hypothetical protein